MVKITQTSAILFMVFCTFFSSIGHLLLKSGADKIDFNFLVTLMNLPLIGGLAFFVIGSILMMTSFKYGELTIVFPILATGYVWVSLLSPLFFPEDSMNLFKWVGVIIVLISVSLLGLESSKKVVSNG